MSSKHAATPIPTGSPDTQTGIKRNNLGFPGAARPEVSRSTGTAEAPTCEPLIETDLISTGETLQNIYMCLAATTKFKDYSPRGNALFDKGGLVPGWKNDEARKANASKRVLITAAAGGVGTMTIQLAKAAGIGSIVAQTSTNNIDLVKSLGATEVVDYRKQSIGEWAENGAEKVDMALDALGRNTADDLYKCIKDDGAIASISDPQVATKKPKGKENVRAEFFIMEPYGWQLDEMAKLVESGQLRGVVDSVHSFEEYEKAFAIVESGHSRGKVIIKVQGA